MKYYEVWDQRSPNLLGSLNICLAEKLLMCVLPHIEVHTPIDAKQ